MPCAAGTIDDDFHAQSECRVCPAGTFAMAGSRGACQVCAAGWTDDDGSAATPCVSCAGGVFVGPGAVGVCADHRCEAGTTDGQGDCLLLLLVCSLRL